MTNVSYSVAFKKSYARLLKQFSKKALSKSTDPYAVLPNGTIAETKADLLQNRFLAVLEAIENNRQVDSFFSPHPLKGRAVETWDYHLFPDIVLLVEFKKNVSTKETQINVSAIGTHRQVKLESFILLDTVNNSVDLFVEEAMSRPYSYNARVFRIHSRARLAADLSMRKDDVKDLSITTLHQVANDSTDERQYRAQQEIDRRKRGTERQKETKERLEKEQTKDRQESRKEAKDRQEKLPERAPLNVMKSPVAPLKK